MSYLCTLDGDRLGIIDNENNFVSMTVADFYKELKETATLVSINTLGGKKEYRYCREDFVGGIWFLECDSGAIMLEYFPKEVSIVEVFPVTGILRICNQLFCFDTNKIVVGDSLGTTSVGFEHDGLLRCGDMAVSLHCDRGLYPIAFSCGSYRILSKSGDESSFFSDSAEKLSEALHQNHRLLTQLNAYITQDIRRKLLIRI